MFGAVDEREGAVGAGAVGARSGVVGEDFALGAGELVAAGAGVGAIGGGSFVIRSLSHYGFRSCLSNIYGLERLKGLKSDC